MKMTDAYKLIDHLNIEKQTALNCAIMLCIYSNKLS